ncbi:MAG: ATP/GTP-binding protein, partial [Erysipelotrichia bacterium]|nr:ATP/GTP-binding protein [Erysipelotrichia bacterium]
MDLERESFDKYPYLLNEDHQLEIWKEYSPTGKESIFIAAVHPENEPYDNLLQKKNADLKRLVENAGLQQTVNQTINSEMRHALWQSLGDQIRLEKRKIPADKDDAKNIWLKVVPALPQYRIFRADRPSTDDDSIAQDPMQVAMKAAIEENQTELTRIAESIKQRVSVVADRTIEKLGEFDQSLASTLTPQFKKDPSW